jgi:hypothetical protein
LDRLSKLITPPRVHKHRYCGVLAPNAAARRAVIATAGPSGATLQVLQEAEQKMGLQEEQPEPGAGDRFRQTAARCWALLLARIYECLPLQCPRCGQPMRLIAFILEPPVIPKSLIFLVLNLKRGRPDDPSGERRPREYLIIQQTGLSDQ